MSRPSTAAAQAARAWWHTHRPGRPPPGWAEDLVVPLARWLRSRPALPDRPRRVGLQAVQGAGKSTLLAALTDALAPDLRVVTVSLDDAYLTRAERHALAATVHPLLATRGVPGTHDVPRLREVLRLLGRGPVDVPRFDKATDDRAPEPDRVDGPVDLVVLEGWCVGLPPVPEASLAAPCNVLERTEDPAGTWRRYVADQLAGPYAALWHDLDDLVVLQTPSWDVVRRWRGEQEAALAATRDGVGVMDEATLDRFLAHYERWTRWGLEVLPGRADVIVQLDARRRVTAQRHG